MNLTMTDMLEMAKMLRNSSKFKIEIIPEHESCIASVLCEKRSIVTREGVSEFYLITPEKVKTPCPLYINIHGGGFVKGHSPMDNAFCSMISSKLGCRVIDIDYRLAPEHPFPAALNECYDIVKWVFENARELGIDRGKIAVGGHSAGGNLAAAVTLMANQSKDFQILLQILDYPFLDAVTDPADKVSETDILPVERMRAFNKLYTQNDEDLDNPFISLVCAKEEMLRGLPPALVITAGLDCLRFEGGKYASMLAQAGVEVRVKRFLKSNHGFTVYCVQEYAEAQKLIADTLEQAFKK